MSAYLDFAVRTALLLWQGQSVRLADSPVEPPFITITRQSGPTWCSVALRKDGRYDLYPVPEQPIDAKPTRLDLAAWSWLEKLARQTGDAAWEKRLADMADLFAVYGFDPRSGLGYFGAQAQFDVVLLGPSGTAAYATPNFKPAFNLPVDILWRHAPRQMDRMFHGAYYGLVTRPDRMDYNRFCYYGSDDRPRRTYTPFNPQHVAFAQTGAILIHWWAYDFVKTGDPQCVVWAKAMADKWEKVQGPETGLVPHWFGSDLATDTEMPPRPYCNAYDSLTAGALLDAAALLKGHTNAPAAALAEQVGRMGLRLAQGLARHGYDDARRIFPSWIRVADGVPDTNTIIYAFQTQEQKDEAVRKEPGCRDVSVFAGAGFFSAGPWSYGTLNTVPGDMGRAAELTRDPALIAHARRLAERIMEEARALPPGPLTARGQWTFDASASYTRLMLALNRITGDAAYLDNARFLMDRELAALAQPLPKDRPEWWRLPSRNVLMEAMLELDEAIRN